ncbi:putative phage abortive infection protein [Pedobacter agri]|uniref:putative phage abortive infection protein n=1 Tax=Pedobacter agri TaxID=454586 RepID=UPI00292E61F1|nr:putative phage abortive infection protein [Pedobacter agri]
MSSNNKKKGFLKKVFICLLWSLGKYRLTKWNILLSFTLWVTGILSVAVAAVFIVFVIWNLDLRAGLPISWDVTGQVGDFFGGVVGTIIAAFGSILIYMSFSEQRKAQDQQLKQFEITLADQRQLDDQQRTEFLKSQIENRFISLLNLHRSNLESIKFSVGKGMKEQRDAIDHIVKDVETCFEEIEPFFKNKAADEIYQHDYLIRCQEIATIRSNIDLIQLAKIDIAYSLVFYGITVNGVGVAIGQFKKYYDIDFISSLLGVLMLKSRNVDENKWKKVLHKIDNINILIWFVLDKLEDKKVREEVSQHPFFADMEFLHTNSVDENTYYRGYHYYLGHYFRHLFQVVKYIDDQSILDYKAKYEYVKTLRSQLSVIEQYIIFYNSLSFMGREWELNHLIIEDTIGYINKQFITKYNFIKNIPDTKVFLLDLEITDFYPDVHFEFEKEPDSRAAFRLLLN